jgi:hypothetical protein
VILGLDGEVLVCRQDLRRSFSRPCIGPLGAQDRPCPCPGSSVGPVRAHTGGGGVKVPQAVVLWAAFECKERIHRQQRSNLSGDDEAHIYPCRWQVVQRAGSHEDLEAVLEHTKIPLCVEPLQNLSP